MSGERHDPQNFLADLDEPQYDLVERPGNALTERPWKPVPILPWAVILLLLVGSVALTFGFAAIYGWLT